MSISVIKVEGLGKEYVIGRREKSNQTFREMLTSGLAAPFRRLRRLSGDVGPEERIWALRDVSFEVKKGEAVGIIGRNGAGKSTLLKILSRITEPTEGRIEMRGRVASLLEVGTAFHPELTGRENTYLNGAILGMSRAEIQSKFDEIVDFSGVEKFIDTPVKRYSSGMYVRLAFAVAAHLEPEILLIDEVLAVGDIAFQRKCLGKMRDIAQRGRTIIFVSHNLPAIIALTDRTLLVERGRLRANGASREVVPLLLQLAEERKQTAEDVSVYRRAYRSDGYVEINSVRVCGLPLGDACVEFGDTIVIDVGLTVKRKAEKGIVVINILNAQLEPITTLVSSDTGYFFDLAPGQYSIRCKAGALPLIPGHYRLNVGTSQGGGGLAWDVLEALPGFRIEGHKNSAWLNVPNRPGVVLFDRCQWSEPEKVATVASSEQAFSHGS